MATQKQIDANRKNSKKSTGPKTPKGKKRVSQNAIRHGLLSAATLIPGEDPAEFKQLKSYLNHHYWPDSAMEAALVASIADCMWRLQRLTKVEAAAYARVDRCEYDEDYSGLSYPPDPDKIPPDYEAELEAINPGALDRQFAFNYRSELFEQIQRYEAHLERKLSRKVEELERLRFARLHNLEPYQVRHMNRFAAPDSSTLMMLQERSFRSTQPYRQVHDTAKLRIGVIPFAPPSTAEEPGETESLDRPNSPQPAGSELAADGGNGGPRSPREGVGK